MPNFQRIFIWFLISVQGLVLLFDADQRNKYNTTASYFYQFEDEFLQYIANDIRYCIALFLLLPLIAGDFFFIKFFAVVAYCLEIVIVENIFIRKDGILQNVKLSEWLSLAIKMVILFFAFEALIMSILDDQPAKPRPIQQQRKVKVQNNSVIPLNQKSQKKKSQ